jgi:hypothetical protein
MLSTFTVMHLPAYEWDTLQLKLDPLYYCDSCHADRVRHRKGWVY